MVLKISFDINVTSNHIEQGQRCSVSSCPLGLAIKEQAQLNNPRVYGGLVMDENGHVYSLALEAQDFITKFDADLEEVKPFSFKLQRHATPVLQSDR